MRRLRLVVVAALLATTFASSAAARGPSVEVHGRALSGGDGRPLRLLGVNRSGAEYACQQGFGFFDGPSDSASIAAMVRWRINTVTVPLNETCWLGINGIAPSLGGESYRATIHAYVERLKRAGLLVILSLDLAAPGAGQGTGILPMADADHAPDFWRSVAAAYRGDHSLLFDLFSEPHDIGWHCWEVGCTVHDPRVGTYRAAGMGELVEAVRSTGATQPLLLGGLAYARNLDGWLAHRPPDPLDAEVASNHTYDFAACYSACRADLVRIARRYPVVTGELGEGDCRHRYIDPYMRWADAHGISYLGWAWNAHGDWTCRGGPTLISDYDGTPTAFGIGFREHLRRISR